MLGGNEFRSLALPLRIGSAALGSNLVGDAGDIKGERYEKRTAKAVLFS